MGKASRPNTPNYAAAAEKTAQGNMELARLVNSFNRPTLDGPLGTQTWTLRPGADPKNPQPGDYIYNTELSPDVQNAFSGTFDAVNAQLGQLAGGGRGVEDAMYRRLTRDYGNRFGEEESALRSRLINSGVSEGSEAWQRAFRDFSTQRNSAYADAADRSVLAGSQEMTSAVNRIVQLLSGGKGLLPGQNFSQMGAVNGPDYLSAASSQNKADWANYDAKNKQAEDYAKMFSNIAQAFITGGL